MEMTNEELIDRLRSDVQLNEVAEIAADRIKELVKERDDTHEEAMEWIAKWGAALVAQREAEAKLAKAVEALRGLISCVDDGCYCSELYMATVLDDARTLLTELEKTE